MTAQAQTQTTQHAQPSRDAFTALKQGEAIIKPFIDAYAENWQRSQQARTAKPTPTPAPQPAVVPGEHLLVPQADGTLQKVPLDEEIKRAKAGNASAVARVEQYFREHHDAVAENGNLARMVREMLIEELLGSRPTVAEYARRSMELDVDQLQRPEDSPLRRLVLDRCLLASLSATVYDALAAKEAEHIELRSLIAKAQLAAERRLNVALKNLEVVARLESLSSGQPATRK
jgi:hypothetical protein